ncbi:glyoxylate carboligase [Pseudovibrio exalbescens]|uniref:glyoxylate carboligase n=1 Tax=Pseudovibrio exalbescens TaxID=197461 RepID=UPI0023673B0D|nr:glyoxylate carboligase [Pseudovibrio exalbescens]MDD7912168.1 glyoxylate carboligase [Pseudovibrio exalbescens]
MAKMRAIEAAVQILKKEGVSVAFGVPGAAINPFYAAMKTLGGIEHIICRHVEGASHMAEGYTRAKVGNIGLCVGTSGPAGTDMITGLYAAMADSIPILCLTGQAPVAKLDKEDFQAVDIEAISKPVTKMSKTIRDGGQMPGYFQRAFFEMRSGRPGPVLLDLPVDVQMQEIEFDIDLYEPMTPSKPSATRAQAERALQMLNDAEKPVIVSGGGVLSAGAAPLLQELAEITGVPVIPTLRGWGSIPDSHELMIGKMGMQCNNRYGNANFLESDFVFGIGNRFANRHTGQLDTYRKGRKFIHVDIEPTQIGRIFSPDLGIISDTVPALERFIEVAKEMKEKGELKDRSAWVAECNKRKRTMLRRTDFNDTPIKQQRVFHEMNNVFDGDTRYVATIGNTQIQATQMLHVERPLHWINATQAGPLGWTMPAAIGAAKAEPEKEVVAISGDYDFQFLLEELAVAAQHNIPYIHVLVNNAYLGLIRMSQMAFKMDHCLDLGFKNVNVDENVNGGYGVDFKSVAEGLGCKAIRVFDPAEIEPALRKARELRDEFRVPVVVEFIVERKLNVSMGPDIDKVNEWEEVIDLEE